MLKNPRPTLLALALSLAALPARSQDVLAAHPEGAVFLFACDGPARWSERFAGTRVLGLVQGKAFRDLIAPLHKKIDEQLAEAKKEVPYDVQAVWDGAWAYGGRVRAAFVVDSAGAETPRLAGYVALGPDGKTDLAALAIDIEKLALDAKEKALVPQNFAGLDWLTVSDPDATFALPRMIGEELVAIVFTAGAEAQLPRLFTKSALNASNDPEATDDRVPALRVQVDSQRLLDVLLAAMAAAGEGDERVGTAMRTLFGKPGMFDLRLSALGEHTELTADFAFAERTPLFDLIAPLRDKVPALLDIVPRQHAAFSCGSADFAQVEPLVKSMLDLFPESGMDWAAIDALVEEHTGVRLRQDFLQQLAGEYVTLSAPPDPDADVEGPFAGLGGLCVGIAVRDGATVARALESVLDKTGVARGRKTEKYRDLDVHRLTVPFLNEKLYWVVTDKLWILGLGDQGQTHLQSLLDGAGAVARGESPPAFPKQVTERAALAPPRYAGISFSAMANTLDAFAFGFQQALSADDESDFDPQVVIDVVDQVKSLLRDHGLEHALALTYHERDRLVMRMIW
jgi:hypothetical protein